MKVAMFGLGYVGTTTAAGRAGPGRTHRLGGVRHVARHDVLPGRGEPGRRMTGATRLSTDGG